jgi:hypothetical protein
MIAEITVTVNVVYLNKFSKNYILQIEQSVQKENNMNTYLVWSSIILHILIFLAAILVATDQIHAKKESRKLAAAYARQRTAYNEELKDAKKAWQKWAKKLSELAQNVHKEKNLHKRIGLQIEMAGHSSEKYYFSSIRNSTSLYSLGQHNEWVLQEESSQKTG